MLKIEDITYSVEGRPLFEGASATIPTGHKVGLVGRNGAGKTTLFRLIRKRTGAGGRRHLHPLARQDRRRRARGAVLVNQPVGDGSASRHRTRRLDGRG